MINISTHLYSGFRRTGLLGFITLFLILAAPGILAQETGNETGTPADDVVTAPVMVDGRLVARVRGVSSYPASQRAISIRSRIIEIARDDSFSVGNLSIVNEEDRSVIKAGDTNVMSLFDIDAEIENLDRKLLSEVVKGKIASVITSYREDRSPKVLLEHAAYALGLTVIFALLFWGVLRVFRRLNSWAVPHVHKGVRDLASKSHHLIQAEQIWTIVAGLLSTLRVLTLAILVYSFCQFLNNIYFISLFRF